MGLALGPLHESCSGSVMRHMGVPVWQSESVYRTRKSAVSQFHI